ncbi:alpha/beta hydrolase [Rhodopirellula sp. P2]|uniref:alpha/beta hydrolase n=1 Tax=Rhodopirellula sp. P2 TaxID=2127060 RepID=UPI002368DD1B|nr:alpha/beta hydrolase [Rhodopirellula sp. P2]WDQ17315.1 alpha/beta hydrolase [Rhodopirellula sp. P2]
MRPIQNWSRCIRFGLLNRFVLRPTTDPIDHRPQIRCRVSLSDHLESDSNDPASDAWIESFVHRIGKTSAISVQDNSRLDDWREIPPPDDLVLKFPGTGGRAERSTPFPMQPQQLISQSAEVWTWNPPGYGGSPGTATLQNFSSTAEEWSQRVLSARAQQSPNGSDTRVWLCGNSLGCLPAMHVASSLQDTLPSAVLWVRNPPDLRRVILNISARWRATTAMQHVSAVLPKNVDAVDLASRCKIPAVFLMSEKDSLVLPEYQQAIHAAYAGPKLVVELSGLSHDDVLEEEHRPAINNALDWLIRRSQRPA